MALDGPMCGTVPFARGGATGGAATSQAAQEVRELADFPTHTSAVGVGSAAPLACGGARAGGFFPGFPGAHALGLGAALGLGPAVAAAWSGRGRRWITWRAGLHERERWGKALFRHNELSFRVPVPAGEAARVAGRRRVPGLNLRKDTVAGLRWVCRSRRRTAGGRH